MAELWKSAKVLLHDKVLMDVWWQFSPEVQVAKALMVAFLQYHQGVQLHNNPMVA
tara:strand:- start:644 stop:808 length:165 start_codon:yes stop_codon:yes gene_type:complete